MPEMGFFALISSMEARQQGTRQVTLPRRF
jgi:hypothetical protein